MGQCAKCRDFFPSDLMLPADDGDKLCAFCVRDTDIIRYGKNNEYQVSRKEIIEEYKLFMRKLRESKDIVKTISDKSKEDDVIKVI